MKRLRVLLSAFTGVLSCAVGPGLVYAQVGVASVVGVVSDDSGSPVPLAVVTVVSSRTGLSRAITCDEGGAFTVPALPPGLYEVQAEATGFRPLRRSGIWLATGETIRVNLALGVGGVAEVVTVSADASLLRSATSALGQVVDTRKVVDLPLNGRSFISLTGLVPGVALPPGSSLPRINGGRPRTNEYLFDGVSVLQPEPGQVAFFPNIDAIQELKVETNSPPAEFGRFNGGVVNLTTKAGTNAFHGTAFEFLRHEAFNARNYFAPGRRRQTDVPASAVRWRGRGAGAHGSHFLLRGLPGPAADHRPDGDLDRAHRPPAPGSLHGADWRPCADDLRPGDDGEYGRRRV